MTTPSQGRHRIYDPDETAMLPRVVDGAPPADHEPAAEPPAADPASSSAPAPAAPPQPEPAPTQPEPEPAQTQPEPAPAPVPSPSEAPTTIFPAIPATAAETPTTIFPAIPATAAETPTAIIPAVPAAPAETPTTVIPVVTAEPPASDHPAPGPDPAGANGQPDATTATVAAAVRPLEAQHTTLLPAMRDGVPPTEEKREPPKPRWNEKLVPLRAKHTSEGYQSVHSELTRTTTATILRTTARGLGEVLITLGAVVLLLFVYEVWGTTAQINAQQDDMARQLQQQWSSDPTVGPSAAATTGAATAAAKPAAPTPAGIAILYIPKLGKRWVVVEGVRQVDIVRNPGHYPGTAMPGQRGNFSVAGHRNRGTFWDLDKVRPGDKIIVETGQFWFIYKVSQQRIVLPSAVEVVSPVPPGEAPGRLLTLTTCNPLLDNYERLIVHARLDGEPRPKSAGRPAELGG